MDQRLNMIMVGTKNVPALRAFYEQGLGWACWGPASDLSIMYRTGTAVLVFLDADYMAKESGIAAVAAPKSLWAIFVDSREEVDAVMARAADAGAAITSAVRDRDLGIYSGYFTDPEGNGWEVAWSPHLSVGSDGGLNLPGGGG